MYDEVVGVFLFRMNYFDSSYDAMGPKLAGEISRAVGLSQRFLFHYFTFLPPQVSCTYIY